MLIFPFSKRQSKIFHWQSLFPWKMAILRNKRKLATLNKKNCDYHLRSKRGLHNLSFWGNWGKSHKEVVSNVWYDKKRHIRRFITSWRLSHERANSRPLQNRSGDVPERICHKPGNERGRLPEWSSSSTGVFQSQTTQNSGPENGHDKHFDSWTIV